MALVITRAGEVPLLMMFSGVCPSSFSRAIRYFETATYLTACGSEMRGELS
jgi:hypothetical protein